MAAPPPRKKRKQAAKSVRDGGPQEAASFIAEQLIDFGQRGSALSGDLHGPYCRRRTAMTSGRARARR